MFTSPADRLRTIAGYVLVVLLIIAGLGLIDLARAIPGPRIPLVLPLRETGHADGVSFLALVAVWLGVFAVAALLAPARRSHVATIALARAGLAFAVLLPVQAVSVQLVRQASFGFDWSAAVGSPSIFIAAACAFVATLACTPARPGRMPARSSDRTADGDAAKRPGEGRTSNRTKPMISA